MAFQEGVAEPLTASQAKALEVPKAGPLKAVPAPNARPRSTDGRVWSAGQYTEHPPEVEENYVE